MQIVIHGTKGGYGIFTPIKVKMIDARPDSNKVAAIGQQAYSINFNEGNVVFSQYRIIRDVMGDKRTGHIAFSVVIPNNQKLSGTDIKLLLDKLSKEYCDRYVVEGNLDKVREDWTFVNELTTEYQQKCEKANAQNVTSGKEEAAFVYYSSEEELQKFFDAPSQEEYKTYKQVFFVKSELEGKPQNPLNALRHNPASNLTGKVELENPRYKLKIPQNTKDLNIEVWANSITKSNGHYINRKDNIQIRYSNNYSTPIDSSGYLTDENSDISLYLTIHESSKTITIKDSVYLVPISKTVSIEINALIDNETSPISDAKIICKSAKNNTNTKLVIGYNITFEGKELGESWIISAEKGGLSSNSLTFIPKDKDTIVLILKPREASNTKPQKPQPSRTDEDESKSEEGKTNPPKSDTPTNPPMKGLGEKLMQWINKNQTISISLAAVVVLLVVFFLFSGGDNAEPNQQQIQYITEYTQGIELNKDTLDSLNNVYCQADTTKSRKAKGGFWQWILGSGTSENDSTTDLPDYCSKIENALAIRRAIDLGDINQLKSKTYSEPQGRFKTALHSIKEQFEGEIGKNMNVTKVSAMNLNQVADFIDNLQKLFRIREEAKKMTREADLRAKMAELDSIKFPIDSIKTTTDSIKTTIRDMISKKMPKPAAQPPSGEDIAKKENNIKTFLKYAGSGEPLTKDKCDPLLDKDFLDKYLPNSDAYEKFNRIPVEHRKGKVNKLKDFIFLIKDPDSKKKTQNSGGKKENQNTGNNTKNAPKVTQAGKPSVKTALPKIVKEAPKGTKSGIDGESETKQFNN